MSIELPMEKCAILMMVMGEEAASNVIQHLTPREVQALSTAMAALKNTTRNDVNEVCEAFREESEQYLAVALGSDAFIRDVLTRALGAGRAAGVIEDMLDSTTNLNGIHALNSLEPPAITELIQDEHPQIITTIMVHLERDRASGVLELLPDRLRNDVVHRIATFGGVQPSALHELTDVLNNMLSGTSAKRSKLGGIRTAAEILNTMQGKSEEAILENIAERDADLAQKIKEEMFVFDNLGGLEPHAIQAIMREVDSSAWAIALKGAPYELQMLIMAAMSIRQAEILREDLEESRPIRLSVVETERKKILQVARRLADEGLISLHAIGDDQYV